MEDKQDYTQDEIMIRAYKKKAEQMVKDVDAFIEELNQIRAKLMSACVGTFEN